MFLSVARPLLLLLPRGTRCSADHIWRPEEAVQICLVHHESGVKRGEFHYSDINYTLLGLVLERLHDGKKLHAILQLEIFEELEM